MVRDAVDTLQTQQRAFSQYDGCTFMQRQNDFFDCPTDYAVGANFTLQRQGFHSAGERGLEVIDELVQGDLAGRRMTERAFNP